MGCRWGRNMSPCWGWSVPRAALDSRSETRDDCREIKLKKEVQERSKFLAIGALLLQLLTLFAGKQPTLSSEPICLHFGHSTFGIYLPQSLDHALSVVSTFFH